MNFIEEERNNIINIIKNNNLTQFENYIKSNNIILRKLNSNEFDILIYSIEKKFSFEIIKYLINQYRNENYQSCIIENNKLKTPFQTAVATNNFKVADILLRYHMNTNTNFNNKNTDNNDNNNIIFSLYHSSLLNRKNLKYLLNNGFKLKNINPKIFYDIIENKKNVFLEIISNYTYSSLVICLLSLYKNRTVISDEQLMDIIDNKKYIFTIDDTMYEKAVNTKNYDALKILFGQDVCEDYILYRRLNKFKLLENAIHSNDANFVKNVLNHETINFKDLTFKKNLIEASKNDNMDIMKLLIRYSLRDSLNQFNQQEPISKKYKYNASYLNYIINLVIRIGNLNLVKYLVEDEEYQSSVILNSKDVNGEYPLITAFYNNKFEIFKYLIEHGADINVEDGHSLLSSAMDNIESMKYIKYILKQNIDINRKDGNDNYPLIKAIKKNNIDIVILLVKYAKQHHISLDIIDKDGNTPLILSYRLNNDEIFRYLAKYIQFIDINKRDSNGNSLLYYAILKQDFDTIEYLVNNGANVNYKNNAGISPLNLAISKGYKTLNVILSNNNNLSSSMPNDTNENPYTSIIKLPEYTIKEKEDIIQKLINNGYKINSIDKDEKSPLVYAIQMRLLSIVKLLVENGADINFLIKNNDLTVLMFAIEHGNLDAFKYLVECNADINFKNKDGHTPIVWAIKNGNPDALKFLIKSGAEMTDVNNLIKINRKSNYSNYCNCYTYTGKIIQEILRVY